MRRNSKAAIAACLVAAAATVLTACGGSSGGGGNTNSNTGANTNTGSSSDTTSPHSKTGYNSAMDNVINPSTKTGGTLNLLTASDCDSWDPQRTYYGWCWNMQRLFTRTLVGYSVVNGSKFVLAPDMATSLGKHNAAFTQWTYTLKPGLKYSNGQPIKPIDIKYGIERLFAADVINGGPSQYFTNTLQHPATYAGPYKDGDLATSRPRPTPSRSTCPSPSPTGTIGWRCRHRPRCRTRSRAAPASRARPTPSTRLRPVRS